MIEDRSYQIEATDSIFQFFDAQGGTDKEGFPVRANPIVALQTGTGKSVVLAKFIQKALKLHSATRILMSTHVKTLISQNHKKLKELWPQAPIGLYSAGLNKKEAYQPIIYGGVRSMVGKYPIFGYRDILCVDECHLISPDAEASYIKLIWELMYGEYVKAGEKPTKEQFERAIANPNCNPYLKVIGFSATPFRQGLGLLTNGPIFTHFCFNSCTVQGWTRMLAEGYLAPLYPRPTQTTLDVNGVKITNGEFNQAELQAKIDKKDITSRCLLELLQHAHSRQCGLIFASGIEHAEHIAEIMNDTLDQECVMVHSGNKDYPRTEVENDKAYKLWKDGKVKWAVNVNSLTTGIDKPELDIIATLRPTLSSVLHVQMLGRGTRPAPNKKECIVLDFAGNVPRLGPIDDPKIPKMKSGVEGDMPVKICGQCGTYNHARATECICCEAPFPINTKLSSTPSFQPILSSEMPIVESFGVLRAIYQPYVSKATQRNMIKVAYYCERLKTFFEYVTVERKPGTEKYDYAAKRGRDWYRQRFGEPPLTNTEVLAMSGMLRTPAKINVWTNKNPCEIMSAEF